MPANKTARLLVVVVHVPQVVAVPLVGEQRRHDVTRGLEVVERLEKRHHAQAAARVGALAGLRRDLAGGRGRLEFSVGGACGQGARFAAHRLALPRRADTRNDSITSRTWRGGGGRGAAVVLQGNGVPGVPLG